jgi:hypothetical protein
MIVSRPQNATLSPKITLLSLYLAPHTFNHSSLYFQSVSLVRPQLAKELRFFP